MGEDQFCDIVTEPGIYDLTLDEHFEWQDNCMPWNDDDVLFSLFFSPRHSAEILGHAEFQEHHLST